MFNHHIDEFKRLSKSYILKSFYGFTIINTVIIVHLTFNMLFAAIKIHNTGMWHDILLYIIRMIIIVLCLKFNVVQILKRLKGLLILSNLLF